MEMMNSDFGFDCGVFSVALAADGIIIPGGKSAPLRKSYVPHVSMDETAGMFTLRATSGDRVVCDLPVHVMWVTHDKEPEPFVGLRCDEPELIETLRQYQGKPVQLGFKRIEVGAQKKPGG
ncbi:MAG: hypothetical protein HKP37_01455 [Boseongicola sp.]|nr:hypothetical protein [Silicimonas sp.]NNL17383.1 hypothetical protein [Boseongicola sp.]